MTSSDRRFFSQVLSTRPSDPPPKLISEYVEGRRILPSNTPFPGPWQTARAEYLREPMDDMSPFSPIQHSVTMKARKIGLTTAAENVGAYWSDAFPTDWDYVSGSDDLVQEWSTRKFDDVIDSLGFRAKIGPQSKRASHRSGDTTYSKEFAGGSARFYSARSKMATRAGDRRLLIRDEIDAVFIMMTTGEGNWLDVNEAHTNSWGARRKIMDLSSPTTFENSNIYKKYLLGDCRKFLVPCPHCGKFQELVFDFNPDANHGLKADMTAGKLTRAYYLCDYCHEAIHNTNKGKMIPQGRWEPTKTSSDPTYRSRQISALYAPVGMIDWTSIYAKKLEADDDPQAMPGFVNTILGLPFQETGSRPNMQAMITLRGDYHENTVPEGVLYLTAGVDVQAGSAKDERNPARLEMEILGHGAGYRTWSIGYQIFKGPTDNAFAGAWEQFVEWFTRGKGTFMRGPVAFPISMIFIDSGNNPEVTYQFCTRGPGMWPVKGMAQILADARRREIGDVPGGYKFYRLAQVSGGQWIYEVNTQLYKRGIFGDLGRSGAANRSGAPGSIQRPSFCDFPMEYADEYFRGLASEEMLADGSFKPILDRNEPLDCRVYAKAAGHVYLDLVVAAARDRAKKSGANAYQIQQIGSRQALEFMAARLGAALPVDTSPDVIDT